MAQTSISGWSGAGSRTFTLTATNADTNATTTTTTITVSVSGESYWYDSHMNVWSYDADTGASYEKINQYAGWDSGVWFTRAGGSATYTSTWTRGKSVRNIRVYIKGYASQYSDKQSYVSLTVPTKPTYVITYNANGGSGAPSAQSKWHGEDITLSSTVPTRSGYKFVRWNTNTSNTGTPYAPGATYSIDAALTIYAIWLQQYTISYNANGGSGAPSAQTKDHGVALTLSSAVPTRTGYNFSKWNTASDGSGTSYNSGASYTANAAATLYAQWTKQTYTISYNANGGSGAPTQQTKTYGTALTLRTGIPTRSGYKFLGWGTSSSTTTVSYNPGGSYTAEGNATLYAVWRQIYTVSYNGNGSGSTNVPSAQTKEKGVALTLSSTVPTRNGYKFLNWNTASGGTGDQYNSGASYTNDAAATLYAQWRQLYTVSYNANGGSGAPAQQTKENGVTLTLSSAVPTRTGYNFLGWSVSDSATTATYYSPDHLSFTSNATTTLYAVWQLKEYAVTYNGNGGSDTVTNVPTTQTKKHDVSLPLSSAIPVRSGYKFLGWGTSSTTTTISYQPGASYTTNAAVTLYAIWRQLYTVSYNANGGSGAPAAQTKEHGVTLTLSNTSPTRSGYDFLGWGTSASATSASYQPNGSYTSNANITLYAVWRQFWSVDYYGNGGSDTVTNVPTSQKKSSGINITLSSTKPSRSGYDFVNWNTVANGTGISYASGATYSANAGASLHAQWKGQASTITSAANKTLGNTCNIVWTPKHANFQYKIIFSIGSWNFTTGVITSSTAGVAVNSSTGAWTYTGYTIPLNDTTTTGPAFQIKSGTTGTMTATLISYEGTTELGRNSKTFTVTVPSNASTNPTLSASVSQTSSSSVINDWGVYVQGYSKVICQATGTPKLGATIVSTTVTGAHSASGTTSLNSTTSIFTDSGSKTFTFKTTDSRGFTATTTKTINIIQYFMPRIDTFTVNRKANDITKVDILGDWDYAPVTSGSTNKNSLTVTLKYRQSTTSTWTTPPSQPTDNTTLTLTGFYDSISFYFQLTIVDTIGNTAQAEGYISTMDVWEHMPVGGYGVAFGKVSEATSTNQLFEIKWPLKVFDTITATGRIYANTTKPVLTGASINSNSAVTISPTTTSMYSITGVGSLPTLTFTMDTTNTKQLNITFGQGALPTRGSATNVWTGYNTGVSNTYAAKQTVTVTYD